MKQVLVIDDEPGVLKALVFALEEEGFGVATAVDGAGGLDAACRGAPDIVLLDVNLPDMSGLDVLARLATDRPGLPVIMISATSDTRLAVKAVKAGAADYVTKPFELDELLYTIRGALQKARMASEIDFRRQASTAHDGVIGTSTQVRALAATISRIAASQAKRVLVLGESGTGKALVARAIHTASARSGGPFVEVNCASLPEQLIEAELFGAEKGSYTGATQRRVGLVALADGGTLFLDEIGELPLALQAKLLHFLEDGQYRPVGGTRGMTADVRVVAATNRDLASEASRGCFREDLYYRLNVLPIAVPALRERDDDVLVLADHFASRYAKSERCEPIRFSPDARACLTAYTWPGNVRELKNLIERLTILHPGSVIERSQLPTDLDSGEVRSAAIEQKLAVEEEKLLRDALARAQGHRGRTAELLGISRHALLRRLQRLGIDGEGRP
ncbi:MAG: sigma-54-dependent Fis family transcriptional regulator [Burkholderiales bacterium]|nr:sigma-54-dependent Fis family transcriptional regulator [Burkholderiales bacterium]